MSLLLSIALCVVSGASPSGQIAFVSSTSCDDQCVSVLDMASGAVQRIGTGRGDGAPVWSPDGSWVAFDAASAEGRNIWVVRADGTDLRSLKHALKQNVEPRWLPGGKALVYSAGEGLDRKVIVYDLAQDSESIWGGEYSGMVGLSRPVWLDLAGFVKSGKDEFRQMLLSLLGESWREEAAFVAIGMYKGKDGLATDLCLVARTAVLPLSATTDLGSLSSAEPDPEGQRSAQLLALLGRYKPGSGYEYVEWAAEPNPKGELIAFDSNDGGDREIFLLSLKKGNVDLSNDRAADWNPVWSPDGKWLAFESLRSGRRGIYRVYAGTVRVFPVALTDGADNWAPAWSPEGGHLAFVSDRSGTPQLYVTDVNNDNARALTKAPGAALAPAWRPGSAR